MPRRVRLYSTWLAAPVATARRPPQLFHVAGVEIADAEMTDLAGGDQRVERLDGPRRAGPRRASAADRDRAGRSGAASGCARRLRPRLCARRCADKTLLTRNSWSRRPAMASPTTVSAPPSAYISAVSIKVMPRSMPSPQRRDLVGMALRRFAHVPGALAERGAPTRPRATKHSSWGPPAFFDPGSASRPRSQGRRQPISGPPGPVARLPASAADAVPCDQRPKRFNE